MLGLKDVFHDKKEGVKVYNPADVDVVVAVGTPQANQFATQQEYKDAVRDAGSCMVAMKSADVDQTQSNLLSGDHS